MCSLNDYDECSHDNDLFQKNVKDLPIDVLCRKCRCKNIDILLIEQSGYCKLCFLTAMNHKFRAALGKSKIIRHGDSVLIDHSGELNSTMLLHLLKAGMSESAHKKLMFKVVVLHIDDSILTKKTNEEEWNTERSKIIKQIKDFGFICYVVSLSEVLKKDDINIKLIDCQKINNENDDQLCTILTKLPDDTSRIDFMNQLYRKLLIIAARKLNCNKIFQADCAKDIATKVLANICLGRSGQLSSLANFCDDRCADIKILKPMKDFTQQELLYYSECYKIDFLKLKEFNMSTSRTSIQALAHNFTTDLNCQFSSTVSAILRTAEKLRVKSYEEQEVENNCILCDEKLDFVSDNEVSTMRTREISRLSSDCISRMDFSYKREKVKSNCKRTDDKECKSANCAKKNKKRQTSMEDILDCLCYSCTLIFQNSDICNILPASLMFIVEQRLALRNMRKEIDDFLL